MVFGGGGFGGGDGGHQWCEGKKERRSTVNRRGLPWFILFRDSHVLRGNGHRGEGLSPGSSLLGPGLLRSPQEELE